ncbi:hypothetical protein D9M68_949290 [compost metagenome]
MTWNLFASPLVPVRPVELVFTPSTYMACAPEAASRVITTWCQLPSFTAACERVPGLLVVLFATERFMKPLPSIQPQNTSSAPLAWSRPKMPGAVHGFALPACVVFM